ncbi:MAG: hypothetical protein JNK67_21195 [Alphaproteobacteria bacterium]|nr:hypothetical protein [Alphaproteobacteria bacterium]
MISRRSLLVPAVAGPLAACGFEPLYGRFDNRSLTDELARIKIDMIPNRSGQLLRNFLLDGLSPRGQPDRPAHVLTVELIEPRPQDLGVARDDSIVRYGYATTAVFKLADSSGRVVLQGQASSVSSYEVTNSEFATVAGRNNARDRVLEEIAHDVKAQLAAHFRTRRPPPR